MPSSLNLRPPPIIGPPQADFLPPTIDWLSGTWHLTHSTLSLLKNNRNVTTSYAIVPSSSAQDSSDRLEDTTSFQTLTSSKFKTLRGTNTARGSDTSLWDWRGKGLATIATSHWEVLGYGDVTIEAGGPGQWFVTYISATRFMSAGISVYSREKQGIPEALMRDILESLAGIPDETIKKLVAEMFEVLRD